MLDTPRVTISETGLASWPKVPNADRYGYKINNGDVQFTTSLSVQLTNLQTISVCAFGNKHYYYNSYYSERLFYSINHEYDITSIEKINNMGHYDMKDNTTTTEKYTVIGKVTEVLQDTYGNLYIEDGEGWRLYIYGLYQNGVRYDALDEKPGCANTIVLQGYITRFVNSAGQVTIEMKNAELITIVSLLDSYKNE